ncbi:Hsp20 family protein [Desulfofundulus thermobenzoicus]|uniref:Hsp20 family protein n=1 Tax=Desulfofundulus thermobenzoicus TaxID=29376 RepID=A0A6N7INF3_9FIRM|nr:Hsp20/alpha crystallin family protein [Desulfofundulus thermobenzoicus]MQL51163.1 Hsp20 family protein [Desulfofundulus thermobenzoicus]HHW42839.1 Hsp20/alpha crystallin family protein [Desulfotomaculum sp.]
MSLIPWNPWRELQELQDALDRAFSSRLRQLQLPGVAASWKPAVDVIDREDRLVIKAELPGVKKEDIDILVTEDHVSLKGEIKRDEEIKEKDYFRSERFYGSFTRTIPLPTPVEKEKTKATFKDGILEIVLPKAGGDKPKQIQVTIE